MKLEHQAQAGTPATGAQGQDAKRRMLHFRAWQFFEQLQRRLLSAAHSCHMLGSLEVTLYQPQLGCHHDQETWRQQCSIQLFSTSNALPHHTARDRPSAAQQHELHWPQCLHDTAAHPRTTRAEAWVLQPPSGHHACMRLSQARRTAQIHVPSATFAVNSLLSQTSQSPPQSGLGVD